MGQLGIGIGAVALALSLVGISPPAVAQTFSGSALETMATPVESWDRDVFFFGGLFHEDYFTQSFTPWSATWEPNAFIGAGYQQFFWRWGDVRFGGEAGLGARFNFNGQTTFLGTQSFPPLSGEAWVGAVARYDGVDLGPVHAGLAMTAGFSAVTGLIGSEAVRASTHPFDRFGTGGKLLYYLGPEIDLSMPEVNPNVEVFWRAQHRSGGFGSLMDLDGSNADTVGVRFKF
jgi:hypothetical protein